ncbi:MFS general substrate transporter [Dacryopinax primogenitus]|uniref:MFS general substrate transporter n=1 Tax=Dacryopinax primogenitus (strain DJM 731) TaxID=1858805 RepID=M5FRA7_DACPD|nr:MFS general substrate transporter [Dacryopinax primogenitus]EJT97469.1 MFS general substrate transporter [Dacryopinax primogenitus]
MSAPGPSPIIEDVIDPIDEKKELEAEAGVKAVPHDDRSDTDTTDVDDALKLVGIEARQFDEKYYRRLRRKIDWHIMPILIAVYFTQFLDKNILSYASIMGFPVTGIWYNDVAQAFYMGFIVWMFPTQYLGQKFPLAKYLGAHIIIWGVLICLHAVCYNFSGFYALRFFLGMLEACVSPTLILIVSMWYKQNERASRIGWFYAGNSSTSIIGGAIAYGITNYNGPIAQWKLLYIVLGIMAIAVGTWVVLLLPDSPVTARFLTEEERIAALERVRLDQAGTHNKHIKKYQVSETFKDIRTWIMILIILCIGIPNGGNSAFNNIITKSFGWTSQQALLLGMPSGVIAGVAVVGAGYLSDYFKDRMTLILLFTIPNLVGMIIMTTMQYSGLRGVLQFASYLGSLSAPGFPLCYAWNASNMSGHTKKVTANSVTLFTFGAGSVVGTYIFLPQDAPGYISGKAAIVILTAIMMLCNVLMAWINVRANRQKRAQLAAMAQEKGWTEADIEREREKAAFLDLTDKENVFFTYTR